MVLDFITHKVTKSTVLWRCAKKGYNARCKMELEHKIILDGKLDHNHGTDDERTLLRHKLRAGCKLKVETGGNR